MAKSGKYYVSFLASLIVCTLSITAVSFKITLGSSLEFPDGTTSECVDVDKAFAIALENNPSLEVFVSRLNQAKQKVLQAKSFYWPSLRFIARSNIGNNLNSKMGNGGYELDLKLSWTFFDGFKRKFENDIAEYGEKIAVTAIDDARRTLLLIVSRAFYDAQLFREKIKIAEADEKYNIQQLCEAETKYSMGLGSLSEISNFRIRLNDAEMRRAIEEGNYKIAMIKLASSLGISDPNFVSNTVLAPLLPESDGDLTVPCWDGPLTIDILDRPDSKLRKLFIKQADANIYANMASTYPHFFLSASVNASNPWNMCFNSNEISSAVWVGMSYDIFTGGLHMACIREAKEREIELRKEMLDFSILAEAEIRSAILKVHNARARVASQRKNIELIQQMRALVQKNYNAGRVSLLRLNEVQSDLIKSRCQLAVTLVDLRQAWTELRILTRGKN